MGMKGESKVSKTLYHTAVFSLNFKVIVEDAFITCKFLREVLPQLLSPPCDGRMKRSGAAVVWKQLELQPDGKRCFQKERVLGLVLLFYTFFFQ